MGCYAEDPEMPILEQNINPDGDASLTVAKCKDTCYRRAYQFAGVQQGDQCWCSSYVGGEWTHNQGDCNVPCTGDQNASCGGKGLLNVVKALEISVPPSTKRNSFSPSTTHTSTLLASMTIASIEVPVASTISGTTM